MMIVIVVIYKFMVQFKPLWSQQNDVTISSARLSHWSNELAFEELHREKTQLWSLCSIWKE